MAVITFKPKAYYSGEETLAKVFRILEVSTGRSGDPNLGFNIGTAAHGTVSSAKAALRS